jgi:AraC-like DNA-binding protein
MHVGNGYAHAIIDGEPPLHVTLLFGRPTGDAARELVAVLNSEGFATPRLSLFDASAVEAIETEAFAVVTQHQNHRRAELERIVTKQAIVTPVGMPGAIVTGYRAVFDFPYPVAFFTDRTHALDFLGRSEAHGAIAQLEATASSHPLVLRLRALLASAITSTLPEVAKQLQVSERSLQRHLQAAGTSFVDEVQAARIAMAKQLLLDTDLQLTAIAVDVGCASLQSFSAMFRRITGESPSQFRARVRRGAPE